MTALDDKLIPKTYTLVETYGVDAVFYVELVEPEDYDPTTGHTTEDTDAGVTRKVTPPEPYEERMVDGDIVQHDDMRIYLPSSELSFTPENGMKVVIASLPWKAVAIDPIYSGTSICLYEIQLRN